MICESIRKVANTSGPSKTIRKAINRTWLATAKAISVLHQQLVPTDIFLSVYRAAINATFLVLAALESFL